VPDVVSYPGSDYYEIELTEYSEQMHSALPPTKLRGYRQVNKGTNALCTPDVDCTTDNNTIDPPSIPHYLGPVIVAQGRVHGMGAAGNPRPVRIKFINNLDPGAGGNLFLPVDESVPGAGLGPVLPGTTGDKFHAEPGYDPPPRQQYGVDQRRQHPSVDHAGRRDHSIPSRRQREERARHARLRCWRAFA